MQQLIAVFSTPWHSQLNRHEKLHLELVNEHGLLYTWQGSDEQLKPILLMAHQDVSSFSYL